MGHDLTEKDLAPFGLSDDQDRGSPYTASPASGAAPASDADEPVIIGAPTRWRSAAGNRASTERSPA